MTFSRIFLTLRAALGRLPSWSWIPLALFAVLLLHGSLLGLTDDEAYYWVLARQPALGYAYHPPMVAWLIALFGGLVRLPSAALAALILALALGWVVRGVSAPAQGRRAGALLLSFAGFFSIAWMMVPDLPMFAGWTAMFVGTWSLCMRREGRSAPWEYVLLSLAFAVALLSKYSAVLAGVSAALSLVIWARREERNKGLLALFLGGVAAAVPVLLWNASHEWASILYQVRDRHEGASINWVRYARFWIAELALAGPVLLIYGALLLKRRWKLPEIRFAALWMAPAALVFCVQPLLSDFKLHWAFVVWWPLLLAFARVVATDPSAAEWRWARRQIGYGFALGALVLLACHVPVLGVVARATNGTAPNPLLDVTNDLYGWAELPEFLEKAGLKGLPVTGARYQTASQAAFALSRSGTPVTLLPRDLKARDEWPSLGISEHEGPEWPRLTTTTLFVTDSRYNAAPEFPGARCAVAGRLERFRGTLLAKWIDVWRCEPGDSRP